MNKFRTLFLLLVLYAWRNIHAEIGCMDNSWHLQKAYDAKDYHYVSCNCPCQRYKKLEDRGTCTKCRHYRDPQPFIIIEPYKAEMCQKRISKKHQSKKLHVM